MGTKDYTDLYCLVGGKQCEHVFVDREGVRWICERVEGHLDGHDSTPVHLHFQTALVIDGGTF